MTYKSYYIYLLGFFITLFFITSCTENKKTENSLNVENTVIDSTKITRKDIAKIKYTEFAYSDLTQRKTSNWIKFNELTDKIEQLKTGDLSFFRDDKAILLSFIADLKNEIPRELHTSAIIVRLKVIETVFLKLEGLASLSTAKKEDLLVAIKDVLLSHNNLIFQINKKFEKESQNIEKPY